MSIDKLSPRQKEIWDYRHGTTPKRTLAQTAKHFKIKEDTVRRRYHEARENLGLAGEGHTHASHVFEARKPEPAAEAIDALTVPNRRALKYIAEEVGMPYGTVMALAKRLDRQYLPLTRALGDVQKLELRDLFAHTSYRVLTRVTDEDIEKASLRDKLVAAAIAVDKVQLLDGEPTQILSVKELENLDTLTGLIASELKRRSLSPQTDPLTLDVSIPKAEEAR